MVERCELEAREDAQLAPYAMRSRDTRGRVHPEPEHPFRMAFQRDRDRIVHCSAFRRLEYKTQVFVNHEGDYYRTRLTHTMETAQITRTVARALGLNEDLAEAIALAHDLGHTPFGHAGEQALDQLMAEEGGFEHNAQSLRIVDRLEKRYPDFDGLNLTWEVREGIVKHSSAYDRPQVQAFDPDLAPCLEAQIVDFADEIAYNSHDLDDGLKAGMLDPVDLDKVTLWAEVAREVRAACPHATASVQRYQITRRIIDRMVSDLVRNVLARLAEESICSVADVRRRVPRLVDFSPRMAAMNRELKAFLAENLYTHYRVTRMAVKAKRVLTRLFEAYLAEPRQLPPEHRARVGRDGSTARVVADYVAGMTDRFALDEYRKLFDPAERV